MRPGSKSTVKRRWSRSHSSWSSSRNGYSTGHTVAQQMDVLPGFALAHGRGKIDVELQRIGGQNVRGWINVRRRAWWGYRGGGGDVEGRFDAGRHRAAGRRRARACRATAENADGTPASTPPRCTCPAAAARRPEPGVHGKDAGPSGGRLRGRLPAGDPKDAAIELNGGAVRARASTTAAAPCADRAKRHRPSAPGRWLVVLIEVLHALQGWRWSRTARR